MNVLMKDVKTESRKRIGEHLREEREAQGWTVEQAATMADVKPHTIEKIEMGVFNIPLDVLAKVADVYGCKIEVI